MSWLLHELRRVDTTEPITVLVGRAAAYAPLNDPHAVAGLLGELREGGTEGEITVLLARDHAALQDPRAVAWLLH